MKAGSGMSCDILVLCGGQGTRLRSVLTDRPKPLAMIDSRPFVDFVIELFVRQGVNRVILCTGYLGHQFEQWYAGHAPGYELVFSHEQIPLGTAGAVRHASRWITSNPFVVVNGDSVCKVDLRALLALHAVKGACATLTLTPADQRNDVGVVAMTSQNRVTTFREKESGITGGFHNAGIYVFNRTALARMPDRQFCSLETDWLPALLPSGVYGFVNRAPVYDIGTPERLAQFQTRLRSGDHEQQTGGCSEQMDRASS